MGRKLFCQLSPFTYAFSTLKCRLVRRVRDAVSGKKFARVRQAEKLPCVIYQSKSLMRRKLGKVDPQLQENKVVNLRLAAPKISGILIRPGETFSFWRLVGNCSARKGYQTGLVIAGGAPGRGVGGGMCQFTNLIHWLVLHTPLEITEHHHHDGVDLFPDYGRQIPFGTGTSILYNYLDYEFKNTTDQTFQLIVGTTEEYLCGELRADAPLPVRYHIRTEDEHFVREGGTVYRTGKVYRDCIDKHTGNLLEHRLIKVNHARVMYDLPPEQITEQKSKN